MNQEERIHTLEEKVLHLEQEVGKLKLQLSQTQNHEAFAPAESKNNLTITPNNAADGFTNIPNNASVGITNTTNNASAGIANTTSNASVGITNTTNNATPTGAMASAANIPNRPNTPNSVSKSNTAGARPKPRTSPSRNNNLEATIGKNVIGVLASILFFIAFIVFGTFIYKNLGNMGKSFLLFVGSFLIIIIGLCLQKKLNNAFSLSVIACGMGCLYITLIINTVYFEFLTELGLYSLLLVWLLGMSLLSKKFESTLLCIIGQCGLYISILFGVTSRNISDFLWFSFFVFFMVADLFYLKLCDIKKLPGLRTYSAIGSIFCCFLISFRNMTLCLDYLEGTSPASGFVLIYLMIFVISIGYSFYHFHKIAKRSLMESRSGLSFLACGYFFGIIIQYPLMACTLEEGLIKHNQTAELLLLFFSIGAILYLEILFHIYGKKKFDNFIYIFNIPYLLFQMTCCLFALEWNETFVLLIPVVVLFGYGFYRSKAMYQVSGLLILLLYFPFGGWECSDLLNAILTISVFLFGFFMQRKYCEHYSMATKFFLYLFWILYFIRPANDLRLYLKDSSLSGTMIYVLLLTPLQILVLKTDLIKNYKDLSKKEPLMEFTVRMMNLLLLFLGTNCLYKSLPWGTYLLLLLATLVLCFLGLKSFLQRYSRNFITGIYIGIKITIYLTAVFHSTPVSNKILTSVLLLCIAVVAILCGFKLSIKSLRIYGLGLTMISVVKLILFDVDYSSTLGTVAALLVCGILCFIINYIYNMLSKYIITETDTGEDNSRIFKETGTEKENSGILKVTDTEEDNSRMLNEKDLSKEGEEHETV